MDNHFEDKLTIDQIAKLCGVSKTTVSRFLNGKYENMSKDTRDRIEKVIADVDYRPNRSAQRLKSSRSMLIGCVIGDISSPFSALLLKGITMVCEEAGYQVLFADSGESAERERRAIRGFLENRVDGLIVNTCCNNDSFLLELQHGSTPLVLADRQLLSENDIDTVTAPNKATAYECVRFLLGQGYDAVGFFSEHICNVSPRILRRQGYEQAIGALCRDKSPEVYEFDAEDRDDCIRCIEDFTRRHPQERSAILCSNGASAQKVLSAMKAMGLEPGYELGLCTFDDWSWLQLVSPGITAVALGTISVGAEAAKLLLERLSGKRQMSEPARHVEIPAQLVPRESTPAGR